MSKKSSSSKSSSKSRGSAIFKAREIMKKEYEAHFIKTYGINMSIVNGADLKMTLKPHTMLLLENFFLPRLGDLYLKGFQEGDDANLSPTLDYDVYVTMNKYDLMKIINPLNEENRRKMIIITNGTDVSYLRKIQSEAVTCVKAIIWFNAGFRKLDFSEASDILQLPHEKKKIKEALDIINNAELKLKQEEKKIEELQYLLEEAKKRGEEEAKKREEEAKKRGEEEAKKREEEAKKRGEEEAKKREEEYKKREEEFKKREEEYLRRINELEEEKEKTLKRN